MRSEELGANNTDQAKEPYALPQVLPVFNGTEKSYPGKDYRIWDWASETWIETTSTAEVTETFESVEVDDPYYVLSANAGEVLVCSDTMGLMKNLFEEAYVQDFIYQNRGKLETGEIGEELSLDVDESFDDRTNGFDELSLYSQIAYDESLVSNETIKLYHLVKTADIGLVGDSIKFALGQINLGEIIDDIELTLRFSDTTEAVELIELDSTSFFTEFCGLTDLMESKPQMYVANSGTVNDAIHLQIKINETGTCDDAVVTRFGYGYFGYGEQGYGGIIYG